MKVPVLLLKYVFKVFKQVNFLGSLWLAAFVSQFVSLHVSWTTLLNTDFLVTGMYVQKVNIKDSRFWETDFLSPRMSKELDGASICKTFESSVYRAGGSGPAWGPAGVYQHDILAEGPSPMFWGGKSLYCSAK